MRNGSSDFVIENHAGAGHDLLATVSRGAGTSFAWASGGPARRMRRSWLDTFDWRLYRAGLSLELQASSAGTELVLTGRDGERLGPVSPARGTGVAMSYRFYPRSRP